MANISFIVKQKLESAIKILCRDFSSHVKRPGKDFSRNRKLPFEEVIRFLLPLQGQCMDQELFRHFSKKPLFFSTDYSGIPHSSAMIQARQSRPCSIRLQRLVKKVRFSRVTNFWQ